MNFKSCIKSTTSPKGPIPKKNFYKLFLIMIDSQTPQKKVYHCRTFFLQGYCPNPTSCNLSHETFKNIEESNKFFSYHEKYIVSLI
jgi:hypothetical protein